MHLCPVGTPDVVGFALASGRFVGIEIKVEGNSTKKARAGNGSARFQALIDEHGGISGQVGERRRGDRSRAGSSEGQIMAEPIDLTAPVPTNGTPYSAYKATEPKPTLKLWSSERIWAPLEAPTTSSAAYAYAARSPS